MNVAYEAVVVLSLQGPAGEVQDTEVVVDIGYSGFLTLPTALVSELSLRFAYVGRSSLTNYDEVSFDVQDAMVAWDGQLRQVKADATGSTRWWECCCLMGTA